MMTLDPDGELKYIPTDSLPDFSGCVFDGNSTDIDNRDNQPLNISEAIFR